MSLNNSNYTEQIIINIDVLTNNLFIVRTTRDQKFRFIAGQFARIGIKKSNENIVWRAYSMVSSPYDDFLEFFSIVVPDGEFTSELKNLKKGDVLLVDKKPNGFLTLDRFQDGKDLWMMATGTGVAPFLSILQDFEVWDKFETIKLIYSVREIKELAYVDLISSLKNLEHLQDKSYKLQFIPIITRENNQGYLNQRITNLIRSGLLEKEAKTKITPENSRIMICGNPEMVKECRLILKERNLTLALTRKPGQIAMENYW